MKANTRIAGAGALLAALAVLWPGSARAATHTVTNLNDSGAGSLRQAIADAANGDVIVFADGLSGTITLASDLPGLASVTFWGGEGVAVTRSGASSAVYGVRVDSGRTLAGDGLAMDVRAESTGTRSAYGVHSDGAMTLDTLSGSVSATTGDTQAYGLFSRFGDLTVDTLSGSVSASADSGSAFGLFTDWSDLTVDTLSGSVSATAGDRGAAIGLGSDLGAVTVDTLSGSVSATTSGDYAYGLYSRTDAVTVDTLSGSVSASAGTYRAYGLFSADDMTVDTLSGSVSATAGGYGAFGLLSEGTLRHSTGSATKISGSVTAKANGLAVAVGADQGMTLTVTGTLSATDTSGAGNAYAIAAGKHDGSGGWTVGGAYNDDVTLGAGASVTGKIDLFGGTNLLTLEDWGTLAGDVSNITTLTKSGSGAWSTTGTISTGALAVDAGTLLVNVTQSATPTVTATGTVTNDGEIRFGLGGSLAAGTFTVLDAAALAGSGTYTTDSPFLAAAVDAANNNVDLTKKSFTGVFSGADAKTAKLASAIDANYATANGELAALISAIEQSSSQAEANAAMDQLTTLLLGQGIDIGVSTARLQSLTTQQRMAELRAYRIASSAPDPDDPSTWPQVAAVGDLSGLFERSPENAPNGLHLRLVRRSGSMDGHDGYDGYDYGTTLFSGGYDRVIDDHVLVGLSAGYAATGTDYEDAGRSESSLGTYTLGLYASVFDKAWYVDAVLSGAYNAYDTDRRLPALAATAHSESHGHTLSAKTEGGYRFGFGGLGLTPAASLEYTRFHQDGYTETGAGAANLAVDDYDANFLESGLGAKLDHAWKTDSGLLVPEVSAMWMHEWLSQDRDVTYALTGLPGTVFSQTLAETAKDSVNLGAGLRYLTDDGLALTARYQGEFEEHGRSHSLLAEVQYVF